MGVVTGGGGGGGAPVLLSHKVTLASADILALGTTPFTLVPAVTGQIIVPHVILARMHYGTTQYVEAGQARVFLSATDWASSGWGSAVSASPAITAVRDAAAFYTVDTYFSNMGGDDNEVLSTLVNVPFRIDESAAVTLGNGTIDFTTIYALMV